jgi:hypothetical protein
MTNEFQTLWKHRNKLLIKDTRNIDTVESPESDQNAIQFAALTLFNELLTTAGLGRNEFG